MFIFFGLFPPSKSFTGAKNFDLFTDISSSAQIVLGCIFFIMNDCMKECVGETLVWHVCVCVYIVQLLT